LQRLDLIESAARDDFSAESDIDVLVTCAGDEHLFERYLQACKPGPKQFFKRKVDIIEDTGDSESAFSRKLWIRDRVRRKLWKRE